MRHQQPQCGTSLHLLVTDPPIKPPQPYALPTVVTGQWAAQNVRKLSAGGQMDTGVGQGRQTPPTQVLGVMGCAVVCGGGGEGGGGTITGCARALIALFGLKTYMVKHILKFNISLKSEQGYQRARARKRGVKLSEGVRKRTWFSS